MVRIALSFDDGRRDNYIAFKEILEPLHIPATFNITSGYVNRDISDADAPGPHEAMTLAELREMGQSDLVEIAGHGYTHDNNVDNLIKGVNWLRENGICQSNEIGLASPHSQFDLSTLEQSKSKLLDNNIIYLRISNDYAKITKTQIWMRRLNKLLHMPSIYYYTNKDSIMEQANSFLLYSIPVLKIHTYTEVAGFIDRLIKQNSEIYCILMFHSILKKGCPFYDDLFSWSTHDFERLCNQMKTLEAKQSCSIVKTIELITKYT